MLYIPWKYDVLHPNWCKYHGNMRFCIQNAVNTMDMKDSRSGSRDHTIGGGGGVRDRGPGSYIIIIYHILIYYKILNAFFFAHYHLVI